MEPESTIIGGDEMPSDDKSLAGLKKITDKAAAFHQRAKDLNQRTEEELSQIEDGIDQADQHLDAAAVELSQADSKAQNELIKLAIEEAEKSAKD
jgi:hypothetical protein